MTVNRQKNHFVHTLNFFFKQHPLLVLSLTLFLLLGLILLSNYLRAPKTETTAVTDSYPLVQTYHLDTKNFTTLGKVNNEGVITVLAQQSGVVQKVNVSAGQTVYKGQQLVFLSSNYQGANAAALQAKLSQEKWLMEHANLWNNMDSSDISQTLSQRSTDRSIASTGDTLNIDNLRLSQQLSNLSAENQARAIQLGYDSAENSYKLAQINASLMRPASPVAGTVEKVYLQAGQLVSAGQSVATVRANSSQTKISVNVNANIIAYLDATQSAYLRYQDQLYPVTFESLPTVPTQGTNYSFNLLVADAELANLLPHNQYLEILLPLADHQFQLVPLSAVYQTQTNDYLYVVGQNDTGDNIAVQKDIDLEGIIGDFAIVKSGLSDNDQIILTNNLFANQKITLEKQN